MLNTTPRSLLFVCTGNICRSPTAEGVMRQALTDRNLTDIFHLDSAGVDSHHIGEAPDPRSQATALRKGVDISDLRARNVSPDDFSRFDVILAMDLSHLHALERMAAKLPSDKATAEIALYLPYAGIARMEEVPDPYYGAAREFNDVYALVSEATGGLLTRLGLS